MEAERKTRVAVIDDHAVVRMGLKLALDSMDDIEVVGEFGDGLGAAKFVNDLRPDVVLLDIRMPGKDGVAALDEILTLLPDAKVVMLTTSNAAEDVYRSISRGARGYVMKDRDPMDIVAAVRRVATGGRFIPDDIEEIFCTQRMMPRLTPRELETLTLLASGNSNRRIAQMLGITEDGVKLHLKHIYEKLDVKDRVGALAVAIRKGLVKPQL
jgi:DNA-binding NarL/FixJ family response regulator